MKIEEASNYRGSIIALLAGEKMPVADLPETLENFVVATEDNLIIGVAGLEIYGAYCLLRSLAVLPAYRNKGAATELLNKIEHMAAAKSLSEIYLLTETAPGYFSRNGYHLITRPDVPIEVQQSSEFSYICPQSAIVMKKTIKNS